MCFAQRYHYIYQYRLQQQLFFCNYNCCHASIAAAVFGFEAVSMVLLDRTVGCKNNVIRSYDYEPLVKQVERFMAVRNIMKD